MYIIERTPHDNVTPLTCRTTKMIGHAGGSVTIELESDNAIGNTIEVFLYAADVRKIIKASAEGV